MCLHEIVKGNEQNGKMSTFLRGNGKNGKKVNFPSIIFTFSKIA